jgi:hypothetical protein
LSADLSLSVLEDGRGNGSVDNNKLGYDATAPNIGDNINVPEASSI